jgi:hypothetical protein
VRKGYIWLSNGFITHHKGRYRSLDCTTCVLGRTHLKLKGVTQVNDDKPTILEIARAPVFLGRTHLKGVTVTQSSLMEPLIAVGT